MTNEQRIDIHEQLITELIKDIAALKRRGVPTLERHDFPRSNTHADGTTSVTTGTGRVDDVYRDYNASGHPIRQIRRKSDGHLFHVDEKVRVSESLLIDFEITAFEECAHGCFAQLKADKFVMTVPLSDLIPLTTGGMSAEWAGKVKDWEILEYKEKDGAGLIEAAPIPRNSFSKYDIWKVKRLSDNSEWVVTDELDCGTIKSFHEDSIGGLFAVTSYPAVPSIQSFKKPAPSVKEWEIVEFKAVATGDCFVKNNEGLYVTSAGGKHTLDNLLLTNNINIHSVRRLTDGVVLTVGIFCSFESEFENGKIDSFKIEYGWKMVVSIKGVAYDLMSLKNPRLIPLFTTADGVPVYNGKQNIYSLSIYRSRYTGNIAKGEAENIADWDRAFSTHAAALAAYNKWLYEQPVLTLGEVHNLSMVELEQLVKDKLAKS